MKIDFIKIAEMQGKIKQINKHLDSAKDSLSKLKDFFADNMEHIQFYNEIVDLEKEIDEEILLLLKVQRTVEKVTEIYLKGEKDIYQKIDCELVALDTKCKNNINIYDNTNIKWRLI